MRLDASFHDDVCIIALTFIIQKLLTKIVWLFDIVDLTPKVNSWPKVLRLDTVGLVLSREDAPFFREAIAQSGSNDWEVQSPPPPPAYTLETG